MKDDDERQSSSLSVIERRKYKCAECGWRFMTLARLEGHMMTHIGMPEACIVCRARMRWIFKIAISHALIFLIKH